LWHTFEGHDICETIHAIHSLSPTARERGAEPTISGGKCVSRQKFRSISWSLVELKRAKTRQGFSVPFLSFPLLNAPQSTTLHRIGDTSTPAYCSESTLWSGISTEKPKKGQKPVLITLSKAMQAKNRRGTVASGPRAGRVDSVQEPGKKRKANTLFDTDCNVDSPSDVGLQRP